MLYFHIPGLSLIHLYHFFLLLSVASAYSDFSSFTSMSSPRAGPSSSALGLLLVTLSDPHPLSVLKRVSPVIIRLHEPFPPFTMVRMSATPGHTSTPRALPTCSRTAIIVAIGRPAEYVIERPPYVRGHSSGCIEAVAMRERCALLDSALTRCRFAVGRRMVTKLD